MTVIKNWVKLTVLDVKENSCCAQKNGPFWAQNILFELFSKSAHYIFLKFNLMASIKKWVKLTAFGF